MTQTTTDVIPKRDWPYFFDSFSHMHRGWIASLEVVDRDLGDQIEASRLRFEGITFEAPTGEPETVSIMFGDSPSAHVAHAVVEPTAVRLERSELEIGTFETLEVESRHGPLTLVRLHAGVTPDMMDLDE